MVFRLSNSHFNDKVHLQRLNFNFCILERKAFLTHRKLGKSDDFQKQNGRDVR